MAAQKDDRVSLGVPYKSNDEIAQLALGILNDSGWAQGSEVDVESICEKHLKLSIIPINQLKNYHGLDAFVTSDFRIMVDQTSFEDNSPRYRFSLAHELAHVVMHSDAYKKLEVSNIKDHLSVQNRLISFELKKIEQQAYRFAGCLLLPKPSFAPLVNEHFTEDILTEMTIGEAYYAIEEIASTFSVSKDVVRKQLMHYYPEIYTSIEKIIDDY